MSIFTHILQARSNLSSHPMRAFLSILGLVIGVVSVTVMVSLWQWLEEQVLWEFDEASKNTISLIPGTSFNPFEPNRTTELPWFTEADVAFFKESMWFIQGITPVSELTEPVRVQWTEVNVRTIAWSKEYMDIESMDIMVWRALNQQDLDSFRQVAVVSENFVESYLETSPDQALGREIIVGDQFFDIIGVIENRWWWFIDVKIVVIPITTAQQKITSDPYYQYLIFDFDENLGAKEAVKLVKYNVLKRQGADHMDDALFQVLSTESFLEQVQNVSNILNLALWGIGAIALLVWWIGVMNIMLVSVTERTREIGIRKAIWATYSDILRQFLIESIMLWLVWCIIGVLISRWLISILQQFAVPALLTPTTLLIAVLFSGGTWVIFGISPAKKAAKMKPIDALRFE